MKSTVVLAIALVLSLSACAKKKVLPGAAAPEHNHQTDTHKPGSEPERISKDSANAVIGTWESPCQEDFSPETDELMWYSSALVLDNEGTMTETFYEFSSEGCSDFGTSSNIGERTWKFTVDKVGEIGNADKPYELGLLYYGDTFSASVDLKSSPDTLQFRGETTVYTRR